jgi:hypothetical protein
MVLKKFKKLVLPGGEAPTLQQAKTCLLKSMNSLFSFGEY